MDGSVKAWLKKDTHLLNIIISVVTLLYISFGEGVIGHVLGGDSEAYYINFRHHIGVAPLYPLLIHIVRFFVGDALYLDAVAWLQIFFLVFSVVFFVVTVQKELKLNAFITTAVWLAAMIPFPILLPEDPIGHTIMTESLTYPLTYLVTSLILKGIWKKKDKYFIFSVLLAVVAGLVRSQMLFLFPVIGVAYFYSVAKTCEKGKKWILSGSFWGRILVAIIVILFAMKSISWITIVHEKVFFDAPMVSYSDQTLVQHMLYLSDEEDEALFEDEDVRNIFERCYKGMMEQKTNHLHQETGLAAWRKIVADCGADSYLLTDVIESYYGDSMPENYIEREVLIADISHELAYSLLKVHWKDKIGEIIDLVPSGFVSTVMFHKTSIYLLIHIFTLLFYIVGVGLSMGLLLIRKNSDKEGEVLLLALLTSIVNVLACNMIHFGLQRYLAYTLGINWVGMILVVYKYFTFFQRKAPGASCRQ